MGAWTVYCFLCGGPSAESGRASIHYVDSCASSCPSPGDEDYYDDGGRCQGHRYPLSDEDNSFLYSVCAVTADGEVSPPGCVDELPGPVVVHVPDTPRSRKRYTAVAGWRNQNGANEPQLFKCFNNCRSVGFKESHDSLMLHTETHKSSGILPGFSYRLGSLSDEDRSHLWGQYAGAVHGYEFVLDAPDGFPGVPRLPVTDAGSLVQRQGMLQRLPVELLLATVRMLSARERFRLAMTTKYMYWWVLNSPDMQHEWRRLAQTIGWLPHQDEPGDDSSFDDDDPDESKSAGDNDEGNKHTRRKPPPNLWWYKYIVRCHDSSRMRNRVRILAITGDIVRYVQGKPSELCM
ncbi:hypothetical protein RI367_003294 [Sorochytrium milnesiophthora]